MAMRDDFAIFILTHGRAENVYTYTHMMPKTNYKGRLYFLIDNEDSQADRYRELYGSENVIVFDKRETARKIDQGDNFDNRKAILYARCAVFSVAKQMGLKYFMMLDDDYTQIQLKGVNRKRDGMKTTDLVVFEEAIEMAIRFMERTKSLCVAFSQGGDWIGGIGNRYSSNPVWRKAMNSFICSTERPFEYFGRMNEDVSTYVRSSMLGHLMFSIMPVSIIQKQTQSVEGGMTEEYKETGTYVKTFYSVMYAPSCVKVSVLKDHRSDNCTTRIHHKLAWNNIAPKIIRQSLKK